MNKKSKAAVIAAATSSVLFGLAGYAGATTGNPVCEAGYGGVCTKEGKTVHLDTTNGGYAAAYFQAKSTQGKAPSAADYSFDYTGDIGGGAPRLSIPIDSNGDGVGDFYVFLAADRCADQTSGAGTVSTNDTTCIVDTNNGTPSYANWDAFSQAATQNGWTVAKKDSPFIISDAPHDLRISNISFVVA